jgi:hypothetical protein
MVLGAVAAADDDSICFPLSSGMKNWKIVSVKEAGHRRPPGW